MMTHGTAAASSRLAALKKKHATLASRIEDAQRTLSSTDFYLRSLKKEKLRLKEEIEGIADSVSA